MFRSLCLVGCIFAAGMSADAQSRYELLVAGSLSDNVVAFNLDTAADRVVAKLANGSQPRALAISDAGEIVVALRGNEKQLVQLVPRNPKRPQGVLVAQPISTSIGRFGAGMIAFDARGRLLVAADTERNVRRLQIGSDHAHQTLSTGRRANTFGLAVHDQAVFVSEYFQKSIVRIDFTADPPTSRVLVDRSEHLDRPCGLTIGHNGHLFVSSLQNDFVQEFDPHSGQFLGTFLDVKTLGTARMNDLLYDRRIEHYFLSSGDVVFELDRDGSLRNRYESPALKDAHGLALRAVRE